MSKKALEFYINESEPVFHEYVGEYPSGGYMKVIGDWEIARQALKEIGE